MFSIDPLRVLDLTDDLALGAARLLVGLGADVVRLGAPPREDDLAEALHWYAGTRRVDDGPGRLDALARTADIVLESGPPAGLRGLRPDGTSRWPDAVHVVLTPFGLDGPRRDHLADDLVLAAAGGMAALGGRSDGPPSPPPGEQALQVAGTHAAIAALLGILARDRTGRGQLVEISAQEAVAATLETAAISWIHARRSPRRTGGVYEHVAHRVFPAADGHLAGGYSGSDRMWTDLLAWMREEGEAEDLDDERYADPETRWRARAHVDAVVARFAARRPAAALAAEARRRALPWAEVVGPDRLEDNPQLRARRFFVSVTGDEVPGGSVTDVGFGSETPAMPRPVSLPAARAVEPERAWSTAAPRGAKLRNPRRGTDGGRVLDGLRVLDLTWVLAGPYVTKQLAEHGADVIKVESVHRRDPTRFAPSMRLRPGAGPDDSGYFINFNRGKRSVALNLRTEEGRGLLRDLVPHCDVVVENFSPGTLARWGLDIESLRRLNPAVVLVSMAGVGGSGPWRDAVTFADTLAAMSGLTARTAEPGGPPQGLVFGLGDMVAANAAVLAVLDLLVTGRSGLVDLSQLEAMTAATGAGTVRAALPPGAPDPATRDRPLRSRRAVPHGVYRARGEDRWVAVSTTTPQAWAALARHLGTMPVGPDADVAERRRAEDAIDAALEAWTAAREPAAAAAELQDLGVPAAAVASGRDLLEDEHLRARGFYPVLEHPIAGTVAHEGIVPRLTDTPGALDRPAPLLGQHTAEVLGELLGLDTGCLAALAGRGVTE